MATLSSLQLLQARYTASIDAEVDRWIGTLQDPGLATMLRYQLGFADANGDPAGAGGKRFRPVLCLLSCEATGGRWQDALTAAAAIELLHNFSLIHDDIEDGDALRRHRPTVWKVWGVPAALNAGDAMFALAGAAMCEASPVQPVALDLVRRFQQTSLALTRGQHLDLSFEARSEVTVDEYLAMIGGKTAALIGFSLSAGAVLAGAAPERVEALRQFGLHLGYAFQIFDDIMGIWGDAATTGKEPANDLRQRKKTLPTLSALAAAEGQGRDMLQAFLNRRTDDVEAVVQVLDRLDARAHAEQAGEAQLRAGIAALGAAGLSGDHRLQLEDLAVQLTGRR